MRFSISLSLVLAGLAASSPLEKRVSELIGDVQNGLQGPCKSVTMIYARGSKLSLEKTYALVQDALADTQKATESGNVGTSVAPRFFLALAADIGAENLAVQGVDYPADIPGYLAGGDAAGSKTMANLVKTAMTQCPETKVVISGYSQGGQLVHNAAAMLPSSVTSKVAAAVIFGDPYNGQPVQGVPAQKTRIFCHAADLICAGQPVVLAAHLTYAIEDVSDAAAFVASAVQSG